MRKTDIVVGVDGSPASWDALYWAVHEAYRWRADLHVVTVDTRSTDDRLARMVADARRLEPSVRITGHLIRGGGVAALRCRMLVVGGAGGFSAEIAAHATVPVVVVRGRLGSEESPIVIGVDGSAGAEAALAVGLGEARLRGPTVIAAFAYGSAGHPWLGRPLGGGSVHCSAYAAVETAVTPWQDKFPWVSVETMTTAEQPLPVLTGLSSHAQLLVVGAQGHDASESLGSVPARLMHRAHCPVMIVR
ncbi:universal stress protein [Virgisporangium aurantiacum]